MGKDRKRELPASCAPQDSAALVAMAELQHEGSAQIQESGCSGTLGGEPGTQQCGRRLGAALHEQPSHQVG